VKTAFSVTSQLRHHYVLLYTCASIDGTFYSFSVTRNVVMIRAKKLLKVA